MALAVLLAVSPVRAEETPDPAPVAEPTAVAPAPNVGLDRLLQLPGSYSTGKSAGTEAEIAGQTAPEWRTRFLEADEAVAEAKRLLADAQQTLEASASGGSQWNLTAPGVQANTSKDSASGLPLRQKIRRLREELDEAERAKRTLEVEADLANVPAAWRK